MNAATEATPLADQCNPTRATPSSPIRAAHETHLDALQAVADAVGRLDSALIQAEARLSPVLTGGHAAPATPQPATASTYDADEDSRSEVARLITEATQRVENLDWRIVDLTDRLNRIIENVEV